MMEEKGKLLYYKEGFMWDYSALWAQACVWRHRVVKGFFVVYMKRAVRFSHE